MPRKSDLPDKPVNGNVAKYLCYREAWKRVTLAREQGFPLEAITILESIIVDRLIAYLTAAGWTKSAGHDSLGALVRRWREAHPQPAAQGDCPDLRTEIDRWRDARNRAVHGIARAPSDAAPSRIDDFLTVAESAAAEGKILARALSNWCEREVRAIAKRASACENPVS